MAGKRDEVTIAEVAEALNISKTTVSRAISGKGRVSEATRARVLDYIGKGRQDAAAPLRTAQQGPTNNLALVIPKHFMRLDLPFLRKCMGGVWNMAAQRGYDLLLCYAGETDVGQLERQLESHKVDGVILSRTMLHDECVQTLQRHNVPFVAIGRVDDDKVPQVDNDQVGATAEMTRLLLQLGMRRIAYMGGCTNYTVNEDRLRGYLICKGFFDTVPVALREAAKLDGASEARIFFQIVIPMSRPILVYTIISSFLTPWTDFVVAKMILNSGVSSDWTVAIGLYNMLQKALVNSYFSRFCAGGVLVAVPISILFVIMQKFYVEGITSGAAKG